MKGLFYLLIIASISTACGCEYIASNYRATNIINPGEGRFYNKDVYGNTVVDISSTSFSDYTSANKGKAAKKDFAYELMSLSEDVCELHKAQIIANSNTWNVFSGGTATLLSGLGAVVGGVNTKAALSSAAAIMTGTRSLVNEEVYVQALATTIIRGIDSEREKRKAELIASLLLPDVSWSSIVYYIQHYHQACSFSVGIMSISKSMENRKEGRKEIERKITLLKQQLIDTRKSFTSISSAGFTPSKYDYRPILQEIERLQIKLVEAPE